MRKIASVFFTVALILLLSPVSARAGVMADLVVDYTPGAQSASDQPYNYNTNKTATPSLLTAPLPNDTTYGGLNPFNPVFDTGQMAVIAAGGQTTLHLSAPVPTNGRNLGVFTSFGLNDVSADGSGQAGTPPSSFSTSSSAHVYVSQDGIVWKALNGGSAVSFTNPANYSTSAAINGYFQPLDLAGTPHASQFKPFLGNLNSFSGQTYDQIKTTLNNSAGGTWLDLSSTGLSQINYVRFSAGAGERIALVGVGGQGAAGSIVPGRPIISESVSAGASAASSGAHPLAGVAAAGANTSHILVDFGAQSYEFDVHYDGTLTGEQALAALQANSDFRFTVKTFSFGDLITGFDYGGYVDIGDGGGGSGFWQYKTSTDGLTWATSGQGAGTRSLTDGSYDGWLWSQAGHATPLTPTAIPEPTGFAITILGAAALFRRRRR